MICLQVPPPVSRIGLSVQATLTDASRPSPSNLAHESHSLDLRSTRIKFRHGSAEMEGLTPREAPDLKVIILSIDARMTCNLADG
mmetsp:Transcript_20365/g.54448  ORF Transcript_20365/g.54448 Transcript_20365/m.54448 type:complete len:85 (+) Transcript_20365:703-957(+)